MPVSFHFLIASLLHGGITQLEPVKKPEDVAEIVEFAGTIKIRPSSLPNWRHLRGTRMLRTGDRLYTDKDSFVRVKYLKHDKTFVTLGEMMVLEVSQDPPLSSYMLKALPSKDGSVVLPKDKNAKVSEKDLLPFADVADMGDGKVSISGPQSETRSLEVEYPIEAIDAIFPRGQIFFAGLKAPRSATVVLPKGSLSHGPLFGTLWCIAPIKRPEWSVVIDQNEFSVPIDDEGTFLFSASTLDGHYRLRPVAITLSKGFRTFLPVGMRRKDVVFVP